MDLSRNSIIDRLGSKMTTKTEFDYDSLSCPPLCSLLTIQDIDKLYSIAHSVKYSGNPRLKYQLIDQVMKPRGFIKLSAGTNRVVYRFLEDTRFVVKVAADDVGISDNPKEFENQFIFKPFVAKCFEVDPTGVVGVFERVTPITSREEFMTVAEDIFELLTSWFIGEYVLADIGSSFFMNWGTTNRGPVLLDYPYAYRLDGNKLFCTAPDHNDPSKKCGGEIDYDDGFNFFHCTKCGLKYRVKELAKDEDLSNRFIKRRTVNMGSTLKVRLVNGNGEVYGVKKEDIVKVKPEVNKVKPEAKPEVTGKTLKACIKSVPVKDYKKPMVATNTQAGYFEKKKDNRGMVRASGNNFRPNNNHDHDHKQNYNQQKAPKFPSSLYIKEIDQENGLMVLTDGNNYNTTVDYKESQEFTDIFSTDTSMGEEYDSLKAIYEDNLKELNSLRKEMESVKEELEQAKSDLFGKEEALEAEKAATDNLSEIVDSTKEQARALLRSHNASIFDIKEKHNIMNSTKEDNIEEVEEVPQVSNLDAVIIKLSDIVDKLDPSMDRMVLAFPDDQGSYFYNGDEEFITVGTINGYKIDHITMVDSDAFNNNTISVDIGEEDLDYAYEGLMKEADKDIKDGEGLEEEK